MLEMQLPIKQAEGDGTAEEGRPELSSEPQFGLQRNTEESGLTSLTKETVYKWFGLHLNPANRIEFMYGLLHMCQPLELRFVGSCLEDLARKDVHVLRDFEIRANSPGELGLLTDVVDPVTRSKLLVCLSLLGSDNRECAGVLFRILSRVDPALLASSRPDSASGPSPSPSGGSGGDGMHDRGFDPLVESRSGFLEQFAVLFTMATLHPAFLFHQRDKLRIQLEKLSVALGEGPSGAPHPRHHVPPQNRPQRPECAVCVNETRHLTPAHHLRTSQRDAVHIEKIVLKGISLGKTEREYNFEVKWSDLSTSSTTKTQIQLENFLLELPKDASTAPFERGILKLLTQGQKPDWREEERMLKDKFLSAPHAFRQKGSVRAFFHCSSLPFPSLYCKHMSSGPPHSEECSEPSSPEEDMKVLTQGHRKKPGSRSPSFNTWSVEGRRPDAAAGNDNQNKWRKRLSGQGESSSYRAKARTAISNSVKGEGGAYTANGVMPPPSLLGPSKGKDASCHDAYGETSSESYSSPSSPQHDGLSDDENGKDTDSQSDDSRTSVADSVLFCPVTGGCVDAFRSIVEHSGPSLRGSALEFPPLHFGHPTPYPIPTRADTLPPVGAPQVPNAKLGPELMMPHPVIMPTQLAAIGDGEKCQSDVPSAVQSFNPSVLGVQPVGSPALQPLLPRFKVTGGQTESGVLGAHQAPVGAISVVQCGPPYPPGLPAAYTSTDPLHSSLTSAESHSKSAGLTLPSALTPSLGLPVPSTGMSPICAMGSVATASCSQVPPPAVPTHTPGPAPSPAPALTHSTAQSDGSCYINSSAANSNLSQQPGGCHACGCRGNCGGSHTPGYYFPSQMAPRQVFNISPVFQLTSMCSSNYVSQISPTPQSNSATQLPFYPAGPSAFASRPLVHLHGQSEHVLGSQAAAFRLQQLPGLNRFYQPVYSGAVVCSGAGIALGNATGGVNKKNGSISCYNCGGSGHYAQDCKQPPMDATQQGGFRLKYNPHPESLEHNPD
ncbi:zinc finger CCHC domain-containing protein 2-like [Brachyhypopomus gauderio]|uniref:zinc finger CCHC domain-containing protein 2-like n=1 Tax=Brachyhypopomus gauderio TaxID=698409 RepID=UPI0040420118